MRVVSLLPSATEIVAELDCLDMLVGRSEECDWPPGVRDLPVVSRARVETASLSSREVDDVVREAVSDGRSLYVVDEAVVEELGPDLVLTQDLCAVCAVASGELCALDVPTLSLDPRTLEEIALSVERVGEALGVAQRGRQRAARMREEIQDVRSSTIGLARPRVFVAEWVDPPYAPGHWIPELVDVAGGENVLGTAGEHSVRVDWDDVRAAEPDLLVLAPCGYTAGACRAGAVPRGRRAARRRRRRERVLRAARTARRPGSTATRTSAARGGGSPTRAFPPSN